MIIVLYVLFICLGMGKVRYVSSVGEEIFIIVWLINVWKIVIY